jgi:Fe-S-cluster-containing dehydrogenase component/DMSO reductase anchor subunit
MRRGFIFSYELCVGCKACSAACTLENGWNFRARNIYTSNDGCFNPEPVVNLSMACNHCFDAVCLKGCPSGAFSKNGETGAVIIDLDKCLGCRYCIWNCPYDAPKFNNSDGIIEKCHFCYHRLENGVEPACSSSCPTGALRFGDIPESISLENYSWFPEKNINPSLLITGSDICRGPVIIPEKESTERPIKEAVAEKEHREWSLAIFTFLTVLSVAINVSDMFAENSGNRLMAIATVFLAAFFSLFHLGSKRKAWRAIGNIKSSPLSREIALFIIYSGLVILYQFYESQFLGIIVSISGVLLVMAIDSVYSFSARRGAFVVHSGQAFLTLLLMISFLLNMIIAFVFIALIKVVLSVISINSEKRRELFAIRFFRLAFLLITAFIFIRGADAGQITTMVIFFSGELADRFIFYKDFIPLNINNTLSK